VSADTDRCVIWSSVEAASKEDMKAQNKHQGLSARIPVDVMKRAQKGGASEVDWYAGRLEDGTGGRRSPRQSLKTDHTHIVDMHRRRRTEEHRSKHPRSPVTFLVALWARAKGHAPRIAG
jgi:hypothetical protein